MKKTLLFFSIVLGVSHVARAQTVSFQYDLPKAQQSGKAPLEFKLNFQKEKYICQKEELWQTNPKGNQMAAPSILAQANAVCGRNNQLLIRLRGQLYGLHGYSNSQRCQVASQQFAMTQGCYCTERHQVVCLNASFQPQQVGRGYGYSTKCERAIKGFATKFAVRARRLKK